MYQEIAVARGSEYDSLNQTMDHCQQNIENLSDEIQRLQGRTIVTNVNAHRGGDVEGPRVPLALKSTYVKEK